MSLQTSAQYQSGEYVDQGNLYEGIAAFMVVGLKESIHLVVQTIPEVTFNRQWLAEKISDNQSQRNQTLLQGIVTDNQLIQMRFQH